MMKILITIFIILLCFFHSNVSFAISDAVDAKVVSVRVDRDGKGIVIFDRDLKGTRPNCVSGGYSRHLSFNSSQDGGKSIMSLALTAQVSGKKIRARGTGSCHDYGSVESWLWGWTVN
ncbi:hypothetical protein AN944_00279 [Shewanella sp. P1-14-1]|nr:hypothetical protein AN944_00279 [Shewanella sp. P1-14-1]